MLFVIVIKLISIIS